MALPQPQQKSNYVCDTLPAPRLAGPNDSDKPDLVVVDDDPAPVDNSTATAALHQPPARKLCFRHQRMADEGTNLKLQQSLDALPLEDREAINAVWSNFSSSSHPRRALILQGLLTMCCFSQLSLLTEQLAHLIRIDPFAVLPREVSLKILGYLDATSLCRAAQVTKRWKSLADDNIVWQSICEQHIGQKCHKCGWGLPILEKKRIYRPRSRSPCPPPMQVEASSSSSAVPSSSSALKRSAPDSSCATYPPNKRHRSASPSSDESQGESNSYSSTLLAPDPSDFLPPSITRPWKDVYSERMTIERNWRRSRYTVRTLKGHTDGVMCLQFNETLSHPAFPVLITGSYDRTVRVWNMETGQELQCMKGHTRAIRALQFDEVKLITGSMDCSIKVWDWRRGKCIRTLNGHSEGVVCLNFDTNVLASGSVDSTIKVWNLRTGGAFTLRGHSDWVNAVQLWDSNPGARNSSTGESIFDVSGSTSPISSTNTSSSQIDPGKMLFSASDDGTIKLWDLNLRTCVRTFVGHGAQVQSMRLLLANECDEEEGKQVEETAVAGSPNASGSADAEEQHQADAFVPKRKQPILISGSLDNTIKLWDIETGQAMRTYFGHIEGVWAVASDKMRLVSGSHDRTIKVWSRDKESCNSTLIGHEAAVSCIGLAEDKIVSGSDDCTIKIWSFAG
ncbi:putative E3 ubiquitin ligase complex SCF subunit sconB [Psilocybe cubensis]|uniref:E3 ubiquitin ligase complex SCF subunit sconB n=2 Tax=Psilocybe cubensis TaxID=181762 RepID=A0ACB8H7C7_PSICU|nr:putative E3 ubiquitin ligase complex SCF subunit sconB [Psilocybe cubensis]KAH9483781.1 putative E3 ubiquitin ligase complex SCF subunit sconB [Psilocybe cubensis]